MAFTVEEQGGGCAVAVMSFLLCPPPVQTAALLRPRVNAGSRQVASARDNEARPFAKQTRIPIQRQRKGVDRQRRGRVARTAGESGVIADQARSCKED